MDKRRRTKAVKLELIKELEALFAELSLKRSAYYEAKMEGFEQKAEELTAEIKALYDKIDQIM